MEKDARPTGPAPAPTRPSGQRKHPPAPDKASPVPAESRPDSFVPLRPPRAHPVHAGMHPIQRNNQREDDPRPADGRRRDGRLPGPRGLVAVPGDSGQCSTRPTGLRARACTTAENGRFGLSPWRLAATTGSIAHASRAPTYLCLGALGPPGRRKPTRGDDRASSIATPPISQSRRRQGRCDVTPVNLLPLATHGRTTQGRR